MKIYEVELDITFNKTVHVAAKSAAEAEELARAILTQTDALPLTEEDLVVLDATVLHSSCDEKDNEASDCCQRCGRTKCCEHTCVDDAEEDVDIDIPVGANGEPMSRDEMMLHLAMYLEDAEDELEAVRETLETIETYSRAILRAGNEGIMQEHNRED